MSIGPAVNNYKNAEATWSTVSAPKLSKRNALGRDLLLLALLICTVYWKLVFSREHTIFDAPDFAQQVLPWLDLQARSLRAGEIALWDPFLLGGQPLAAQMQPGVTNPLTYLLLITPLRNGHLAPAWVHAWIVLLHLLAGAFTYLLARDRRLPSWAAIGAGLLFAAGGYPGHTHWPQHLSGILWLPLVALFSLRVADAPASRAVYAYACGAGLFLGLAWLSGHPQVPMFATLGLVAFHLARLRTRAAIPLSVTLATAMLVSAAAWLPAVEYGRHAVRWVDLPEPYAWNQRIPHHVHERNALPASSLPHFLIPGEPASLANPFAGGVALLLVAAGLLTAWPRARWWGLAALLALLFALARDNPFHGILHALVPMLDKARTPSAALAITQLGIAMTAAYGLAAVGLLRAPRWPGAVAFAVGLAAFVLILFEPAALMRIPAGPDRLALSAFLWMLAGVALWRPAGMPSAAALLLLAVFELSASVGFDYRRFDDKSQLSLWRILDEQSAPAASQLRTSLGEARVSLRYEDTLVNFGDWHGIETTAGYLPGVLAGNHALGWWEPRVLDLYSASFTLGEGFRVSERPGAHPLPRAWSVHEARSASSLREAARQIVDGVVDPRRTALVTGGGPLPALEACQDPDQVRVAARRGLHEVVVQARLACRGLVILNDNNYPGWVATVDGRPAPILTVNAALRGVVVEAGTHELRFTFRPASVYWGAALSLFGLVAAAFFTATKSAAPPESRP